MPCLCSSLFSLVLKYFCPSDTISEVKASVELPSQDGDRGWSPLSMTVEAKDLLIGRILPSWSLGLLLLEGI